MPRRRAPECDPRIAVAYLRVSTDEQALGHEAQREAIARWATSAGVCVVAEFADHGVSGGTEVDRRPGLMAALQSLGEHRAGLLVVAKRDRLARDVVVAASIEKLVVKSGARVASADGTGCVRHVMVATDSTAS